MELAELCGMYNCIDVYFLFLELIVINIPYPYIWSSFGNPVIVVGFSEITEWTYILSEFEKSTSMFPPSPVSPKNSLLFYWSPVSPSTINKLPGYYSIRVTRWRKSNDTATYYYQRKKSPLKSVNNRSVFIIVGKI